MASRVEDLARWADVHVQDPSGHPVPRRLAVDGRRRQGQLRQDPLPARRGPQHPEASLLGGRERGGPGPEHRGVQAQVPLGLALRQTSPRPWNVIFPKKYLDKDPNYFKNNVIGSGPFRFKSYTRGSTFEGERNPDYFVKDRPYLDGYKFFISTETSVRAAAIRSGRAYIEFRDLPMAEVESIRKQLGDKVVVQQTPFVIHFDISMNNTVKPFTDIRVRKALTLAHRSLHRRPRSCTGSRVCGTSGRSRGRARSGRWRRPSSRSSRASGATRRRTEPRPGGSWPRRATRTASRWS